MNLYELTNEFIQLQNMIEDPETESEAIEKKLETINGAIEYKAENYAKIIKNLENSADTCMKEIERLHNRKNLLEAGAKRLRQNLQLCMVASGKKKFRTDLFTFNIQKNGGLEPVILDVDVEDLPDDLVQIVEKPDMTAIRNYILDTGDTQYAHLGDRGESLRIR